MSPDGRGGAEARALGAGDGQQPRNFATRLRSRVQQWGWRRTVYWQVMHPLAKHLGFHLHYVQIGADRRDLIDPEPPKVPEGYVTRLGRKEDFEPFVGRIPDLDQEFLDEAFVHNDECSVTFHGEELVSFSFNTRTRARVTDQLEILVPDGFRYGYKGWTHPDHRRRNLTQIGTWVKQTQAGRPFEERSIWYVETHNYASLLRGYRNPRERHITVGLVGWITLFGRQIPFASRGAKWIGFHFSRRGTEPRRQYID